MTEGALAAAEAAAIMWRIADDQGFWEKLADFFKKKETILVLGSTGCGKTNLLTSLAAAAGLVEAIPRMSRTTSAST